MNWYEDKRVRIKPISEKEIRELRQQIRIGDEIPTEVVYDEMGERLAVPVRIKERVTGKYRHLITLESTGKRGYVRKRSVTYAELLMNGNGCLRGGLSGK